jgi:DNA-binding NarL/FixJ family response regulator
VADDDPFARRAIADALRRAGIIVIAEAPDGAEAVELVRYHRPDVVLMDILMPGVDGIAATRRILRERADQVIILVSAAANEELALIGIRAGAVGFLTKDVDLEALSRAVEGAMRGEAAMSRTLARRVIEDFRLGSSEAVGLRPIHSPLTSREWEVLDQISQARTVDEIASAFVVSPETIRSHVKHIRRKLGVSSHAETVAAARRIRRAAE